MTLINSLCVHACAHVYLFCSIGELLGIDYLLSQTGKPLQVDPDSEEAENMLEDVALGEEEDEGFEEDQTPDLTVPGLLDLSTTQPVFSSLAAPIQPPPILAAASSMAPPIQAASSMAADASGVCRSIVL